MDPHPAQAQVVTRFAQAQIVANSDGKRLHNYLTMKLQPTQAQVVPQFA